jgi:hypothetical protein
MQNVMNGLLTQKEQRHNCEPTIKNLRMIAKKTLRNKTKECNHKKNIRK